MNNKTNSERYETRINTTNAMYFFVQIRENAIKGTVVVVAGYVLHFWRNKSIRVVVRVVVDDADKVGEVVIVFIPKDQTSGRRRHEGVVHARRGRLVEC